MLQEYNVVIADTTCFILLAKINRLEILHQLFKSITTTIEVANEFGKPLPDWVIIVKVKDTHYQHILGLEVDEGEASAMALSLEYENPLLILDDLKARKLAFKLNLHFSGTFGVLLKAKEAGIITTLKPLLEEIQDTNFRFSDAMLALILATAKEK